MRYNNMALELKSQTLMDRLDERPASTSTNALSGGTTDPQSAAHPSRPLIEKQPDKLGCSLVLPRVNAKNPDLRELTLTTWEAIERVNDPPELFKRENAIVLIAPSSASESVSCRPV